MFNLVQRKIAGRVFGIHIGVVLFLLSFSGLKGCFQRKPRPEIVTFIEFGQPAPAVPIEEVQDLPDPEPPAPDPEPQPEPPPPEPERIPEKPKKIIKPKKVEPKPPKKVEPKWKPTPVDQIKVSDKRIEPAKPAISEKDIQNLRKIQQPAVTSTKKTTGPVGNPNEIAAYDGVIYRAFYSRWVRDNLAPTLKPAKVTISINSSGRVLSSRLSQSSGDSQVDAAVMSAVRSVSVLPKAPPRGYEFNNIVITFTVTD